MAGPVRRRVPKSRHSTLHDLVSSLVMIFQKKKPAVAWCNSDGGPTATLASGTRVGQQAATATTNEQRNTVTEISLRFANQIHQFEGQQGPAVGAFAWSIDSSCWPFRFVLGGHLAANLFSFRVVQPPRSRKTM